MTSRQALPSSYHSLARPLAIQVSLSGAGGQFIATAPLFEGERPGDIDRAECRSVATINLPVRAAVTCGTDKLWRIKA